MFSAVLISKNEAGQQSVELTQVDDAQLPEGDVTVKVEYSTLNYKDGLAITGKSPVVRKFPMVPGIDLVGTVSESSHADWKAGDTVVLNGWGVGEGHWGGLSQKARLNGNWLVPLPAAFTPKRQTLRFVSLRPTKAHRCELLVRVTRMRRRGTSLTSSRGSLIVIRPDGTSMTKAGHGGCRRSSTSAVVFDTRSAAAYL